MMCLSSVRYHNNTICIHDITRTYIHSYSYFVTSCSLYSNVGTLFFLSFTVPFISFRFIVKTSECLRLRILMEIFKYSSNLGWQRHTPDPWKSNGACQFVMVPAATVTIFFFFFLRSYFTNTIIIYFLEFFFHTYKYPVDLIYQTNNKSIPIQYYISFK